jgi:hypothetical protein
MTENEWGIVLFDVGGTARQLRRRSDGERLVYIMAEAFDVQAKVMARQKRPDRAARLRWIVQKLTYGGGISKTVMGKAAKDIEVVRGRLVNGVSESGL